LGVEIGREADAECHGGDADQGVAGGFGEGAGRVLHIATHLAEVFERQTESEVADEPDYSRDAVTFGDFADGVFTGLDHLVAEGEFKFVREGFCQPLVDEPCNLHRSPLSCHRCAL
jgi:hypothetical protein